MAIKNRTLFAADNLDIMRHMDAESIDLIYLDPPFNSHANYNTDKGDFSDKWNHIDANAYDYLYTNKKTLANLIDIAEKTHSANMRNYLIMLSIRLLEMQRILKARGSIYLHCDPHASHYIKLIMDSIFKSDNFRSEIIWSYDRFSRRGNNYPSMHDVILFYTKSEKYLFGRHYLESKENLRYKKGYHTVVDRGRRKLLVYDEQKMKNARLDLSKYESVISIEPKKPILGNNWSDIPILNPASKERTGYPTQKPQALLDRIIRVSCIPNYIVLDPFCGSGTTLIAAEYYKCQWMGIDISHKAINISEERFQKEFGLFYKTYRRTSIFSSE